MGLLLTVDSDDFFLRNGKLIKREQGTNPRTGDRAITPLTAMAIDLLLIGAVAYLATHIEREHLFCMERDLRFASSR